MLSLNPCCSWLCVIVNYVNNCVIIVLWRKRHFNKPYGKFHQLSLQSRKIICLTFQSITFFPSRFSAMFFLLKLWEVCYTAYIVSFSGYSRLQSGRSPSSSIILCRNFFFARTKHPIILPISGHFVREVLFIRKDQFLHFSYGIYIPIIQVLTTSFPFLFNFLISPWTPNPFEWLQVQFLSHPTNRSTTHI